MSINCLNWNWKDIKKVCTISGFDISVLKIILHSIQCSFPASMNSRSKSSNAHSCLQFEYHTTNNPSWAALAWFDRIFKNHWLRMVWGRLSSVGLMQKRTELQSFLSKCILLICIIYIKWYVYCDSSQRFGGLNKTVLIHETISLFTV